MSRLKHLCLGACSASLLALGIFATSGVALAAPGDPQYGPSQQGSYANEQQYGNQQYGNQQYGNQEYGNQQYGNQEYGNQERGNQEYGNSQYGGGESYESSCQDLHKIAAGENLTSIAASYGVSVEALAEANDIEDTNVIVIDTALCIPASEHGYGKSSEYGSGPGYGESQYASPDQSYGHEDSYSHEDSYGHEDSYAPQQENSYAGSKPGDSYDPNYGKGDYGKGDYGNQGGYGKQESSYSYDFECVSPYTYDVSPGDDDSSDSYGYNESYGHDDSYGSQSNAYVYDPNYVRKCGASIFVIDRNGTEDTVPDPMMTPLTAPQGDGG